MSHYKPFYMLYELMDANPAGIDPRELEFAIEHCLQNDYDVLHFGPNGYFIYGKKLSANTERAQ